MDYAIEILSSEWIATSLSSIAFILFILYIGKISSEKNRIKFIKIIALIMILFTISNHTIHLINGTWTLDKQLPVHLCGISALICCVIMFIPENKRQFLFEFLFYCGIIGGTMSILTPLIDNYNGSVNFFYIQFFVKHAIIIAFPIYLKDYLNMELRVYSWLKTLIALNVLLAFIIPLNFYIGSNYMYLAEVPAVDNPLILTTQWPYYILTWEVIILILFLITYYFSKPKKA
jgi:hypothetical integral membrane protein (TIGR02206 family)